MVFISSTWWVVPACLTEKFKLDLGMRGNNCTDTIKKRVNLGKVKQSS